MPTKEENMEIANTILNQMGGMGRIQAFIGARYFAIVNNGIVFGFPHRLRSKPNEMTITLDRGRDLYNIQFARVVFKRGYIVGKKELKSFDGIFCDQLMDIFEQETDLFLTFNPRR